jgi:hypothetical protein
VNAFRNSGRGGRQRGLLDPRQERFRRGRGTRQAQPLQGATDRSLVDSQPPAHPAVGLPRPKPPPNNPLSAPVQLATTSGTLLGHQAVDPTLAILPLPAGLGRHAATECLADPLLRGKPRLTQYDRYQPQMHLVRQGDAIDRFVPVEDNPVAFSIDESHRKATQGATVRHGFFQGQQRESRGVLVHTINTHTTSNTSDTPFTHSATP